VYRSSMERQSTKAEQIYLTIGAVIGWFSVISQFYLNMVNRQVTIPEAVIRYFSYFTILTNILVALCFTVLSLKGKSNWRKFFSRPKVLTAIAAYISFVGIVYNILLRHLWNPEGLQLIVDELLHSLIPILFILYWLIFVTKTELEWKNTLPWMIYPLVYLLYVLTRGALSGFYPYPFIDVNNLGYSNVLINDGGLMIAFMVLSLIFVAIGKLMSRSSNK
jgi:hypothetical protein